MAKQLRYAVEVDLRGFYNGSAWEHTTTSPTNAVSGGFLRVCTGPSSITIGGAVFAPRMLLESGLSAEAKRVDIGDSGNYATFSTFKCQLDDTKGLGDLLRSEGIFLKNCPVKVWAVEDATPYLRWKGVVDDDPRELGVLGLECIDESKQLHGYIPNQEVSAAIFGWAGLDDGAVGKAVPVCIGQLQDALLYSVTRAKNRYQGVYGWGGQPDLFPLAYFPSVNHLGVASLRTFVVGVGQATYLEGAFVGRYIRVVSGKGEGVIRRVLASSASTQIQKVTYQGSQYNLNGVTIEVDAAMPFEMADNADPVVHIAIEWSAGKTYTENDIAGFRGEVYKVVNSYLGTTSVAAFEAPPPENQKWYPLYRKVPQLQGDAAFCADAEPWPVQNFLYYPTTGSFKMSGDLFADTSVFEFYDFQSSLLASANPVAGIDVAPDAVRALAGFRTKKDGVEYPLAGAAEFDPAGPFPGRQFAGLRMTNASFVAERKVSSYQKVGSAKYLNVGYYFSGSTSGGGWQNANLYPPMLPVSVAPLNDSDPATIAGADLNYLFTDSIGVQRTAVGRFPAFGSGGSVWAWIVQLTLKPDLDDLSDYSDIVPAARFQLDGISSAACEVYCTANIAVAVATSWGRNIFKSSTYNIHNSNWALDGTNPGTKDISLYSLLDDTLEAAYLEIAKAVGLDAALAGKGLQSWISGIELTAYIQLYPKSGSFASFQPGLRVLEAGLAAKEEVELGDLRASLRGELWGNLDPLRRSADSYPETFPSVLEYLMRRYDGLETAEINTDEIDRLETLGVYAGLPLGCQLVETKEARQIYIELLGQGMLCCSMGNDGRRTIRDWMSNRTPIRAFSPEAAELWERIIDGSLEPVDPVPLSRIYTEGRVNYDWSNGDKAYLSSLVICNTDQLEFPAPDDAVIGSDFFVDIFCAGQTWVQATFTGAPPELSIGDLVNFEWSGQYYVGYAGATIGQPDGTTRIEVLGYTGSRPGEIAFSLPLADVGTSQLGANFTSVGGLLWQTYAQGFYDWQYADAKAIWQRFRDAYKRVKGRQELPAKLRDTRWIKSWDNARTGNGSAVAYLDLISRWVTFPKNRVRFAVQAEDNLDLQLLDCCSFTDPMQLGGAIHIGWIEEISLQPRTGQLEIQLLLDKDAADPYDQQMEIDEGAGEVTIGNLWGDIDEDTDAANIDEQGGF